MLCHCNDPDPMQLLFNVWGQLFTVPFKELVPNDFLFEGVFSTATGNLEILLISGGGGGNSYDNHLKFIYNELKWSIRKNIFCSSKFKMFVNIDVTHSDIGCPCKKMVYHKKYAIVCVAFWLCFEFAIFTHIF